MSRAVPKKRLMRYIGLVVSVLIGVGLVYAGYNSEPSAQADINGRLPAKVIKVYDGDTAELEIYGQTKKVRFIGMDTPETHDPRKPVQCFGQAAADKAAALLSNQTVYVEYDPLVGEVDKYGRQLSYIFFNNGQSYNELMISQGFAHEYTYQEQVYKYQAKYLAAELKAKTESLGFWSPSTCNGDTTKAAQ